MHGDVPHDRFWGKAAQEGGRVVAWHPAVDHCVDVAACAEALLLAPTWNRRLARLAGQDVLDGVQVATLSVLAGLHDFGKLNHDFQEKLRRGTKGGHVVEAVSDAPGVAADLGVDRRRHRAAYEALLFAVAHHGGPPGRYGPFSSRRWNPASGRDPRAEARRLRQALDDAFPGADPASVPSAIAFLHAWSGLVMLADWLGSDTRAFPYAEDETPRVPFARARAREALVGMGILGLNRPGDVGIGDLLPGATPRPAQATVDRLPTSGPSLVVLEAETGSGKTEAALARFLRLYAAGEVDGLYFALPTRAAATQIHTRVHEALARVLGAGAPPHVLAVPGYLRVDDVDGDRSALTRFEALWPDEPERRWRYWAAEHAKRFMAGAIVIGTVDQVLLSGLRTKHAEMRATALLRQLLVVDEVHASDERMAVLLRGVLDHHLAAGGHAVLLSATLGVAARQGYERIKRARLVQPPPLEEAVGTPYPRVALVGRDGVSVHPVAGASLEKRVRLQADPWLETPDAVVGAVRAAIEGGRVSKVLCIRNTVGGCLELQAAVEAAGLPSFRCAGVATPHHSRYAPADRKALDAAVEEAFRGGRPFVLVATQTVEQSLDIDADLLITDLCPADVLLQRVGRLYRHRLAATGDHPAEAHVLVPDRPLAELVGRAGRGPHGLGSVYPDLRVLDATWNLLRGGADWTIPRDNRRVVEGALHPEVLRGYDGGPLAPHGDRVEGVGAARRQIARGDLLDRTLPFELVVPPPGALSTRASDEDAPRRAPLGTPWTSPFGVRVDELRIPERFLDGVPDETPVQELRRDSETIEVELGERGFLYGRLGLRRRVG